MWAYAALFLGGLVSISGNVLHSFVAPKGAPADWSPEASAVGLAAFWPIALYTAIEVLARTDWKSGWLWKALRFGGLIPVAGVAAIVSYNHLSGLLQHFGEARVTVYAGPLAVDGLIVMATTALIGASVQAAAAETVNLDSAGTDESGPEYDPHESAGRAAGELLDEISEYLSAEAERLEVKHLEWRQAADDAAAKVLARSERLGLFARLAASFRTSGEKPSDDELLRWLADEADRTGIVPSRADCREFWPKVPGNTRLEELRRQVIQARAEQSAEALPETAGR